MEYNTDGLVGVFFTDGGARPNPGYAGSGVYGFLYDPNDITEINPKRKHPIFNNYGIQSSTTLVDDLFNSQIDAIAPSVNVEFEPGLYRRATFDELISSDAIKSYAPKYHIDLMCPIDNVSTNNRAELRALTECLKLIKDIKVKEVYIYSDSMYAIRAYGVNIEAVIKRGWTSSTGGQLLNKEEIEDLHKAKDAIPDDVEIRLRKVKSHVGYYGNERADVNATKALIITKNTPLEQLNTRNGPKVKIEFSDQFEPAKIKYDPLRILNKHHIYMSKSAENAELTKNTIYKDMIIMGDHGSNIKDIARSTSKSSYSVAFLYERCQVLHDVSSYIRSINEWVDIYSIDRKKLYNPLVMQDYLTNGFNYFYTTGRRHNFTISNKDTTDIAEVFNMAWLAYHGFDMLISFSSYFESVVLGEITETVFDITKEFYDINEKVIPATKKVDSYTKTTLTPITDVFSSPHADIQITYPPYLNDKLRLIYDHDLPDRNTIQAYSKLPGFKLEICIIPINEYVYRYFTIMTCVDGKLISVGYPSNMKVIVDRKEKA